MSLTNQSFSFAHRTLRNRWVLPPMVIFHYNDEDGLVSPATIEHYRHYAQSGVGTVIVEATCISEAGRLAKRQLGLWSDAQIVGHRQLAQAIKAEGALALVQIHHAGLKSVLEKVAPSDYQDKYLSGRALSSTEIEAIQAEFIAACQRAQQAGYDGVELHGAHGYLLSQFLSPDVNQRHDQWGGSIEGRAALAVNIIRGVKDLCGDDFLVTVRMGGNENDAVAYAKLFEEAGADLLHISYGFSNRVATAPDDYPCEAIHYSAEQIKAAVNVPVIAVFMITSVEQADLLLQRGSADLIAIGRSCLIDPNWFTKALKGEPVTACRHCKGCAWHKGQPEECVGRKALLRKEPSIV